MRHDRDVNPIERLEPQERVLDDIWANEGGVSVRVIRGAKGELRIEFTDGVGGRVEHAVTLTSYRARRLGQAIATEYP